jgi:tetratricopeptide (TPR) repeat protein
MKNVMPKGRARTRSHFKGETCSRLSVRGVTNARHASSAWRFAQRSSYSAILLSAILWPFVATSSFAQGDADFAKANQEFAQGHFKEAISAYEALIRDGQWSASVFYNLGNAYFRAGDFGRAILNYERALALERHHPEATANLQIARDDAGALELQPSWPERYLQFASVSQYSIAAAAAFWVAVFCLAALIFTSRRSAARIGLLVVMLLIFAGSIFAIWQLERGSKGDALAIVTGKNVQARLATADTANAILALPPGSEIKVLSTRGDWIYAALPNHLRGWIPAKNAEQVRL